MTRSGAALRAEFEEHLDIKAVELQHTIVSGGLADLPHETRRSLVEMLNDPQYPHRGAASAHPAIPHSPVDTDRHEVMQGFHKPAPMLFTPVCRGDDGTLYAKKSGWN